MSLDTRPQTTTADQYAHLFATERAQEYPAVDSYEDRAGYRLGRDRLESAARVLSCPFKAAAPNWQHGRVIYAAARAYLAGKPSGCWTFVDIGTAKGFSALCAQWALIDHAAGAVVRGAVTSVDVFPPLTRARRNTPAEVDGLKTLPEILAPWPEADGVTFLESTGIDFLTQCGHVHFAFVDGKHSTDAVSQEWRLLADRQEAGDVAIFDDVQIAPVAAGLKGADACYLFERLALGHVNRAYSIGVRR